jgi:hypothetical protein
LSGSAAAIIKSDVPFAVLLFGSRPASSSAASSLALPNSAVRAHVTDACTAPDSGWDGACASGSEDSSASTAHDDPA